MIFTVMAMSILPYFLLSLLMTSIFCFVAPLFLIGIGLSGFGLMSVLPSLGAIGREGVANISQFLATFGNGNPLQGCVAIGIAFSLAGILFDSYVFYQKPRGDRS